MSESDNSLQTFMLKDAAVRGSVVVLSSSLDDLFEDADYSNDQRKLLAECVMANVLMTSHLKVDGLVSIQAKGEGAVRLIATECNSELQFRGVIQSNARISEAFQEAFNDMTLTITLAPNKGKRYQGIVPLADQSFSKCLEHYFIQSEQLPTLFKFSWEEGKAVGVMIQALPEMQVDKSDHWQRVSLLANTLTHHEMQTLSVDDWLYRLFHEEGITVYEKRSVTFQCTCSRERFERALISLGEQELRNILKEEGMIETECQFCHKKYVFDESAISLLLASGSQAVDH